MADELRPGNRVKVKDEYGDPGRTGTITGLPADDEYPVRWDPWPTSTWHPDSVSSTVYAANVDVFDSIPPNLTDLQAVEAWLKE